MARTVAKGTAAGQLKRLARVLYPENLMLQSEGRRGRGEWGVDWAEEGRAIWHLFGSIAGATNKVKRKTGCV